MKMISAGKPGLLEAPGTMSTMIAYGFAGLLIITQIPTPLAALITGAAILAALILHLYFRQVTYEKRFWGNLVEHHFVVDWGPYGPGIVEKIPVHLHRRLTVAPAMDVEEVFIRICSRLHESGNYLYSDLEMPIHVKKIYFGVGQHFREQGNPEAYISRVVETMEAELEKWHRSIYEASPKKAKPEWYKETFIDTHQNGSVM